jgi:hypothetical protein
MPRDSPVCGMSAYGYHSAIRRVDSGAIYPVIGLGQMMRHCREHLVLHLIPSPSGFFVAGLEGGGPRDGKSQRRRCISARFLSRRGFRAAAALLTQRKKSVLFDEEKERPFV